MERQCPTNAGRWTLSCKRLSKGDANPEVERIQQYLARFGYLDQKNCTGQFDDATSHSIRNYQRQHALEPTGEIDPPTIEMLQRLRCGNPDTGFGLLPVNSVHSWHAKRRFTYRFINGTADLAGNTERQAIRNAFSTWANAIGMIFTETTAAAADFHVEWATGAHGGTGHAPFDGVGNTAAHAYFPPPSGGRDTGQMHFDDAETWALTGGGNVDLEAAALHEIGHLLGLDHTSVSAAVMFPTLTNGNITLNADDLARISRLYPRGRLWHSIRSAAGPWTGFGDIEGAAGERGQFATVGCANVNGRLHVCGVTDDGRLWHAIRSPQGPWTSFGDVEGAAGDRGRFVDISCAGVGSELHVCGVTDDGRVWHSIRNAAGPWTGFGDVEGAAGERGAFVNVACADDGMSLHACGVTNDGRLWHSIRSSAGSWTGFGDVEGAAGERGRIVHVDCAIVAGSLHVCAINDSGSLWHSIRSPQGSWAGFGDVEVAAGERGRFVSVGCADIGGNLHVCGITDDGHLWHSIRSPQGPWTGLRDVEGAAGERGDFSRVACAGIGSELHTCGVTSQ